MVGVFILPTAGFDVSTGLPTKSGLARIRKTMEVVKNKETGLVAILGGKRDSGPSEADLYFRYICDNFSGLIGSVKWIVDAQGTCTNQDLVLGTPLILEKLRKKPGEISVGTTSYPFHLERIEMTLLQIGYMWVEKYPSGESQSYPTWKERLLLVMTFFDPGFRFFSWLSAWRRKLVIK